MLKTKLQKLVLALKAAWEVVGAVRMDAVLVVGLWMMYHGFNEWHPGSGKAITGSVAVLLVLLKSRRA